MLTTPLHLTDDELLSLTHLRRPSAQARAALSPASVLSDVLGVGHYNERI
jgi:hypothetical protein